MSSAKILSTAEILAQNQRKFDQARRAYQQTLADVKEAVRCFKASGGRQRDREAMDAHRLALDRYNAVPGITLADALAENIAKRIAEPIEADME